jgi:hypothetical protein
VITRSKPYFKGWTVNLKVIKIKQDNLINKVHKLKRENPIFGIDVL